MADVPLGDPADALPDHPVQPGAGDHPRLPGVHPAFIVSGGRGGPSNSTLFYTLYLYERGFAQFRMGYAAAMAWLLLLVIALVTALFFGTSRRWVFYSGEDR